MGQRFHRRDREGHAERGIGTTQAAAGERAAGQRLEDAQEVIAAEQHPLEGLLRPRSAPDPGTIPVRAVGKALRRDTLARRALAVADMVAAAIALVLAIMVFGGDRVTPGLVAGIPLVVVVSKVIGLYDRDQLLVRKSTLEEAPALFQVAALFTLLIWLGEEALVEESTTLAEGGSLGNTQVLGLWALLFVSMLAGRALAREIVRMVTPPERCLALGNAAAAAQIDRKFRNARSADAEVVGRVPLDAGERFGLGPEVLGEMSDLDVILSRHEVERVIIAPTSSDSEQLLDTIRLVKSLGVKVSVLPRLFEVVGSSVIFDDVEGLVLLGVPQWGLTNSSAMLKRSVDLLGAFAGLFLLSPLFAAVALAVKGSSPGPVFFRQTRIGRDGEEFEMLKFRTMHVGADERKGELLDRNEAEGLFKIADDPRLTDVGRLLRRSSLDELPQLINVLRGDMSLVGPRPLVADDDRLVEGSHRRRLDMAPGMTGIWQVLGSSRIPLREMVKIDYLYGANWSLWLDVKILLRTIPHVAGRRGL